MNKKTPTWYIMLVAVFLFTAMGSIAEAAPILVSPSPASFGEIERITLDDPSDVYSGGVMVCGGIEMILPKNLLIDLPANRLSLQQIFDQAPAACKANGESGLAKADKCNVSGSGGIATLSAVRTNAGNVIVGDLFIQKAAEVVTGRVTYINYDQGFYRVNGIDNDPNTGAMVRLNDPTSRHTIQNGAGCIGGPNCSPDRRFGLDPDNYTNVFATGYPVCIPSTLPRSFTNPLGGPASSQAQANGTGDYLCPSTNRTPGAVNEPAVADSRRFAPVMVGDSVVAEGNFETINGVRFLSAHTSLVQKALQTQATAGQPDYLLLEEVGTEAPPFQNQRLVNLFIGFTTLAPTDVDIWSIHRDPVTNEAHEFPYASVTGCDNASGGPGECSSQGLLNAGANIFKINYKVDFNKTPDPRLSPCAHLRASRFAFSHPGLCAGGVTHASDFGVMSPSPHEIIARTGRKITSPAGSLITIDINGNPATNGEYLFPLGLNLGGLGVAEMSEIDINALDTPIPFEGIPWNLDRRLGPSGCLKNGGVCEAGAVGSAAFALDPFPYSGMDPRLQSPGLPTGSYSDPVFNTTGNPLTNIRNRMFSYVNSAGKFNGNATLLPYALGSFPADPPLIAINPTPALNIFPPIAFDDIAATNQNVAVNVNVAANDIPVLGSILAGSVTITSPPSSGAAVVNADNSITYTPPLNFTGTVNLSYIIYNNYFAASAPANVTINVFAPVTGLSVTTDKLSPQAPNTPITFVAAGVGGSGNYEYQFWLNSGAGYVVAQPYSTSNSWTWTSTATGSYDLLVDVRNTGSTVARDASTNLFQYKIATPATSVTLVENLTSPQPAGTSITFTATAAGGSGPYEYRFWVNEGNGYAIARNYSATNTFVWKPAKVGNYDIMVDTRIVNTTVLRDALVTRLAYKIAPLPATAVTITPSVTSPQLPGSSITFTAAASGGTGPYEYRFWINAGGTYLVAQNYSTTSTFTWTPTVAGNYDVMVDTRAVGSTNFREALAVSSFYQIKYAPATGVTATTDKASPQPVNAPIVVTAAGSGGSGKYEYRFWLNSGSGFTVVQDYSTLPTWTWFPTVIGNFDLLIDVRNAGTTSVRDASTKIFLYRIQ